MKKTSVKKPLQLPVLGTDGKSMGKVTVPDELFGANVNKQVVAQAVRVYLANQRAGSASTKTRGEVEGSTRKIYRQKGTGRARHGSIRAPIFIGGGIVFGPKPRDYRLGLPKKMKRIALVSVLTAKFQEGNVYCIDGLSKLKPKTKLMAKTLSSLKLPQPILLILPKDQKTIMRSARNIPSISLLLVDNINPYALFASKSVLFTKDALHALKEKP